MYSKWIGMTNNIIFCVIQFKCNDLFERVTEFSQNAVLAEHLPLETVLIIVMDSLSQVSGQLMEGHVLLHLLILWNTTVYKKSM